MTQRESENSDPGQIPTNNSNATENANPETNSDSVHEIHADAGNPGSLPRKYYVQSASVSWIITAKDASTAAQRMLHNAMKPAMKSRQKISSGLKMIDAVKIEQIVRTFGAEIHVSESGFGSDEAGVFDCDSIFQNWLQQMTAIESLLRKLA